MPNNNIKHYAAGIILHEYSGGGVPPFRSFGNWHSGDLVWAWDEETGDTALKPVKQVFINESDELIHLTINGEEITTTPTHPFYVAHKGWYAAVSLRAGDILVLLNGQVVRQSWDSNKIDFIYDNEGSRSLWCTTAPPTTMS